MDPNEGSRGVVEGACPLEIVIRPSIYLPKGAAMIESSRALWEALGIADGSGGISQNAVTREWPGLKKRLAAVGKMLSFMNRPQALSRNHSSRV